MYERQYYFVPKLKYPESLKIKLRKQFNEQNTELAEWRKYGGDDTNSIFVRPIDRYPNDAVSELEKQINPNILYPNESFKWAKMKKGCFIPAHMDGRNLSIIVPVFHEETFTLIYDEKKEYNVHRYDDVPLINEKGEQSILISKGSKWNYGAVSDCVEIHRWTTDQPFVLNGQWPHGVDATLSERVIITISFNDEYDDWDKIQQLIETGKFWNE